MHSDTKGWERLGEGVLGRGGAQDGLVGRRLAGVRDRGISRGISKGE